jgi:hypothetical protein
MKKATELKNYLNLPDGHLFDTWAWEQRILEVYNKENNKENWLRYETIRHAIHIFDSPTGYQGMYYSKPSEYLAIGFYESNRPKEQILEGD